MLPPLVQGAVRRKGSLAEDGGNDQRGHRDLRADGAGGVHGADVRRARRLLFSDSRGRTGAPVHERGRRAPSRVGAPIGTEPPDRQDRRLPPDEGRYRRGRDRASPKLRICPNERRSLLPLPLARLPLRAEGETGAFRRRRVARRAVDRKQQTNERSRDRAVPSRRSRQPVRRFRRARSRRGRDRKSDFARSETERSGRLRVRNSRSEQDRLLPREVSCASGAHPAFDRRNEGGGRDDEAGARHRQIQRRLELRSGSHKTARRRLRVGGRRQGSDSMLCESLFERQETPGAREGGGIPDRHRRIIP